MRLHYFLIEIRGNCADDSMMWKHHFVCPSSPSRALQGYLWVQIECFLSMEIGHLFSYSVYNIVHALPRNAKSTGWTHHLGRPQCCRTLCDFWWSGSIFDANLSTRPCAIVVTTWNELRWKVHCKLHLDARVADWQEIAPGNTWYKIDSKRRLSHSIRGHFLVQFTYWSYLFTMRKMRASYSPFLVTATSRNS